MTFKHNFEINLQDIDFNKKIKNKSLLHALENTAAKHSDSIQRGLNDIMDNGETWVLLDWKMQVLDRPKYGDTLEVHTWVRSSKRVYSYRDFEVYVNGEKKVIGSSKWLLVDVNTLKPVKILEEWMEKYNPEPGKSAFDEEEFDKLKELEAYDEELIYPIRKSDIDINNHVHNLNYVDMVYEILQEEKDFNYIRISYKKEIKYEDKIKIMLKKENFKYHFLIKNVENDVVHAIIEMM